MNVFGRFSVLTSIGLLPILALSANMAKKKPNVLFILADDFGYHDMSCMGSKFYETPNIDKIASQGMIFTNGYAACQVCSPSRASIMTGKFPARHGISDWIGAPSGKDWRNQNRFSQLLPPGYVYSLPSKYITLPEALKEAGYQIFFAGKWHLGEKGSWPEDHGFDTPVSGTDFYPTILELAGLKQKPEEHSEGVSRVPLLKGKQLPERSLIWHYPHYGNQGGEPSSIIRKADWKLIHYYEDGREELYNLKTDLSETRDVSGSNQKLVSELHQELFDYLNEVGARFPEKDPLYSAEAEQKYLDEVAKTKLPQLEKQRLYFLSKDFNPKNMWWGSEVTKD